MRYQGNTIATKVIDRSPDFSNFSRTKSYRPSDFSSWDNLVFSIDCDRLKHFTIMAETTLERIVNNFSELNYKIEYLYLPNLGLDRSRKL
jgi:hypothetical protein